MFVLNHRKSAIVVFTFSLIIFGLIMILDIGTDIKPHIELLGRYLANGLLPMPPLYFLVLHAVSLLSFSQQTLIIASILILSASVSLKFSCSYLILRRNYDVPHNYLLKLNGITIPYYTLIICLMFAHPIAISGLDKMYLGRIPGTIWHNSTTIFLTPFALLLFHYSFVYFSVRQRDKLLVVLALAIVNILIKPSFFFVFVVAFPLFLLIYDPSLLWRDILPITGVIGLCLILLSVEYYFIYNIKILDKVFYNEEESNVVFSPFLVWDLYSSTKALDLMVSVAFPIIIACIYRDSVRNNKLFIYGLMTFAVSLLILICFAEEGPRLHHFNFIWQAIISNYILFTLSAGIWIQNIQREKTLSWRASFTMIIFAMHLISGALYIYNILVNNSYR